MIAPLKAAVAAALASVPSIGTIETEQIDHDDAPRELRGASAAYWGLSISQASQQPAAFGGGAASRQVFRSYTLTLTGWYGIKGTTTNHAAFEALVRRVLDRLSTAEQQIARYPGVTGFQRLTELRAAPISIVRVTADNSSGYRAHRVTITATLETFETIKP